MTGPRAAADDDDVAASPIPEPAVAPDSALGRALTRFGFTGLRAGQSEVIADVLAGRPVVAVMPTGAGKSLCYQLPASILAEKGGVTLVVSPLIALIKDQVDALRARGIAAAALTSAASPDEQRDILDGIRAGLYTLVYVAPERFKSPRFMDALRSTNARLALIAIDEAHCISEWGHDFRPEYRRLGEVVRELAAPRIAAFTATATPEVRLDIAEQLGMTDPRVHVRGFDRPNLYYAVDKAGGAADKAERLVELVRMRESGVALVYAATRKNVEKYAAELSRAGMRVRVYHAGLGDRDRESAQDVFMAGKLDAIVATNAFGMGVDKSDIRLVVHADLPRSPEAYYQEAGRGGRDGRATKCVLLFNHGDTRVQEMLIDSSYPTGEILRAAWKLLRDDPEAGALDGLEDRLRARLPGEPHGAVVGSCLRLLERHGLTRTDGQFVLAVRPDPGQYPPLDVEQLARRKETERGKLRTMIEYAYWPRCRRQFVLDYFGDVEWRNRDRTCGACDTCDAIARGAPIGMDEDDKATVRAMLMLVGALSGRFGRTRLAGLANGTDDDPRFEELSERGCLRGWSQKDILELIRALEGAGLVEASRGEYPTIATTRKGDQIAIGKGDLDALGFALPVRSKRGKPAKRKRS
ncbi:MAG: ATP-dependent DNA helicase [Deltaproteobacteria bacterium]|nr:ATP-dependent DNA helicase [Deltaproteobacteria bacterium]